MMNVTPEEAEAIYHEARSKAMIEASNYSNPVVQRQCDLKGWEAVIHAIKHEVDYHPV